MLLVVLVVLRVGGVGAGGDVGGVCSVGGFGGVGVAVGVICGRYVADIWRIRCTLMWRICDLYVAAK